MLEDMSASIARLSVAVNQTEESRRTTNEAIERIERRLAEDRRESNNGRTQGEQVERGSVMVDRWFSDREPSIIERRRGDRYVERKADEIEASEEVYHRNGRRPHGRIPGPSQQRDRWEDYVGYEDDRRRDRHHRRGPRKPKVDFPHFDGGDPYEWLDKVDHYFRVNEIAREDRVTTACIYLDGKANSWWRWIKTQYDDDGRHMGWTAFEKEFLNQWGPSPVVNHHGQLAKLKQEGKVQSYIEEFRRLQTMVKGRSEETLIGTFIEGLKPWLSRELKLKQPQQLSEAMRMAEILGNSHYEKRLTKENMGSKFSKNLQNKNPWKGNEVAEENSKGKAKEVKKLSREEVQERIRKGLCFKCGNKWGKDH